MYQLKTENQIAKGIFKTAIDGLFFVEKSFHEDERGFFSEIGRIPEIEAVTGQTFIVKQINHARSIKNVVRGIHAEGWNKFIFVTAGKAFCALADLRPTSPTFKAIQTFVLGFGEGALIGSLYVPMGVGNSYAVLDGPMDYVYFVDRLYADRDTSGDAAISLFDPKLAIDWPIGKEAMILSERDKNCISL
ncbi:MAG: dTDP-4-dehydrorhamnose 3,5-epimerase family protein [Candidatus Roizmanbacteria bacterium]|nr:dTDP-4-dehydrorhamnose 3,5-epimerase family protein [Candidatus Roizmanbacteria bacterium]